MTPLSDDAFATPFFARCHALFTTIHAMALRSPYATSDDADTPAALVMLDAFFCLMFAEDAMVEECDMLLRLP